MAYYKYLSWEIILGEEGGMGASEKVIEKMVKERKCGPQLLFLELKEWNLKCYQILVPEQCVINRISISL